MVHRLKMALAAAALMGLSGGMAQAETAYTVYNETGQSVWVTSYGSFGNIIEAFCLANTASHSFTGHGMDYDLGVIVYTRGELKQNTDCTGKTLSDTGRGSPISISFNTVRAFNLLGGSIHLV